MGQYLNHFTHDKYMKGPFGIVVNQQNGDIMVANRGTNTITIHTGYDNSLNKQAFGTLIKVIGDNDGIKFVSLNCIATNSNGNVIVSSNDRIDIFSSDYQHLKSFGTKGENDGELQSPYGVFVDRFDNILVCDVINHRVQVFDCDGNWIHTFKKRRDELSDDEDHDRVNPAFVTLDPSNDAIFVVDSDNNKVVMF